MLHIYPVRWYHYQLVVCPCYQSPPKWWNGEVKLLPNLPVIKSARYQVTPRCSRGPRLLSGSLCSLCSCLIYQSIRFILQLLSEKRSWTEDPLTDSKLVNETEPLDAWTKRTAFWQGAEEQVSERRRVESRGQNHEEDQFGSQNTTDRQNRSVLWQ